MNIHYNSQKHWVTSFQYENGDIYLIDSSTGGSIENCLNDSLKIHLAQIYGNGRCKISIHLPFLQQQNNGHGCGLFAIANMLEFVTNRYQGLQERKQEFKFVQNEMQKHLVKCFTQKYMEPFPKQKLATLRLIDIKKVDIDLFCCCSVPEVKGLGPWIACDTCDKLYLQKCEGVKDLE